MGSREEQRSTLDAPRMSSIQKTTVHKMPTPIIDLTISDTEPDENQQLDKGIHPPPNPSVKLSWGHVFKHQARQTLTSLRQPGQRTLVDPNHSSDRLCLSARKQKLSLTTILPGRAPPIEVRSSDGQQSREVVKALGKDGKGISEDHQDMTRTVLHQPVVTEDNLEHDPQEDVLIDGCDYPLPDDQHSDLNASLTDHHDLKSIAEELLDPLAHESEEQHSVDAVDISDTGTALLEVDASIITREYPQIVSECDFEIENVAAFEEVMTYEAREPDHEMESSNGMKDINVLLALYAEADVPVTDSSVPANQTCCSRCNYSFPLSNGQNANVPVDKMDAATTTEPSVQKKMVDAETQTDAQELTESTGTNTDDKDSFPSLELGRRHEDDAPDPVKKTLKDSVGITDEHLDTAIHTSDSLAPKVVTVSMATNGTKELSHASVDEESGDEEKEKVPETPKTDLPVDPHLLEDDVYPTSSVSSKTEEQQGEMSSCRVLRKRKAVDDTLPVQLGRKNKSRTIVGENKNDGEPAAKRGRSAKKTAELASTSTAQMKPASEIQMLFDGAVQEEPVPTVKAPKKGGNGRNRRRRGRRVTAPKSSTPIAIFGYPAVDPGDKPLIPIPLKRNSRYDKPQPPPCQFVQLDRSFGEFVPWYKQENWESGVFP